MDQSLQRSQIIQLTQGYQSQSGIWQLRKIDIIVQHNKMNELIYLQDGEILKKELLTDYSEEVNNNIEMIKYAFWNGQMNNQNHKFGRWNAFWKGKRTIIGGYYDQNNLKKGKWAEFFNKYWDRCQVIFIGEYYNGKKYGLWETLYRYQSREQYQIIGLHNYDRNGFQQGKSYDISDKFWDFSQIFNVGEQKDDKKFGRWNILDKYQILIGGGNYNQKGQKIGKWIELYDNYWNQCQVIQIGEYENDIKVGLWKTQYKMTEICDFQEIGGGLYKNYKKTGFWKELYDNFHNQCQVIYFGEYVNGIKIGLWSTLYKGFRQNEFIKIGGGYYSNGQKIKSWVELHPNFQNSCQVIYQGLYDEGIKQGNWETLYKIDNQQKYQNLETGLYEKSLQEGRFCEIHSIFFNQFQFLWVGQYKKGQKTGKWDIIWLNQSSNVKEKNVGGGTYINGLKNGQWVELIERFSSQQWLRMISVGEYINGKKTGNFKIESMV